MLPSSEDTSQMSLPKGFIVSLPPPPRLPTEVNAVIIIVGVTTHSLTFLDRKKLKL